MYLLRVFLVINNYVKSNYNSQASKKYVATNVKLWRINLLFVLFSLSGVSFPLYFASNSLARKCQGFVFCVMFIILIGACWNYYLDKAQIQMINTCLEYESNILEGEFNFFPRILHHSTSFKHIYLFNLIHNSYYDCELNWYWWNVNQKLYHYTTLSGNDNCHSFHFQSKYTHGHSTNDTEWSEVQWF